MICPLGRRARLVSSSNRGRRIPKARHGLTRADESKGVCHSYRMGCHSQGPELELGMGKIMSDNLGREASHACILRIAWQLHVG